MKTLILSALAAIAINLTACNSNSSSVEKSTDSGSVPTAGVTYTCPMHPEVLSDKPGTCPKCKMDLVEKTSENTEDHSGHQH